MGHQDRLNRLREAQLEGYTLARANLATADVSGDLVIDCKAGGDYRFNLVANLDTVTVINPPPSHPGRE